MKGDRFKTRSKIDVYQSMEAYRLNLVKIEGSQEEGNYLNKAGKGDEELKSNVSSNRDKTNKHRLRQYI